MQRIGCIALLSLSKNPEKSDSFDSVRSVMLKDGLTVLSMAIKEFQGNPLVEKVARRLMDTIFKNKSSHANKASDDSVTSTEVDVNELKATLAATRKQLQEKSQLLAKTQKKLDQVEGDKVKYKNQLRTAERKLKKNPDVHKSPVHKTDVPVGVAKSTVLAELKAKKIELEENKKMENIVQGNKSAVLEEIRKRKSDSKDKRRTREFEERADKSEKSEKSDKSEKSEKSESVEEIPAHPTFVKNEFSIKFEGDVFKTHFDPTAILKDHLDHLAKAKKIDLDNFVILKPDGTLITDLHSQLCSLGVLEVRMVPSADYEDEEKQKVSRKASGKKFKSSINPETPEDDPKSKEKMSGISKILKRKSQPRPGSRSVEREKKPTTILITKTTPNPAPTPVTEQPKKSSSTNLNLNTLTNPNAPPPPPPLEASRKNSDPARHRRGSSGPLAAVNPVPAPPNPPNPPPTQTKKSQSSNKQTKNERNISNRRADKTDKKNTEDRIFEYKEEIEMLKEDLASLRNVFQLQTEQMKLTEIENEKLKTIIRNLSEELSKAQNELKISVQKISSETPRVSENTSPRTFARLKKQNKELQKQNEQLSLQLEKLKKDKQ
uniref:Uncharacterized protein n=1 Tax=Arcella intermedia TaxID=1963864 RepID=A0A6B2L055_9EUKA